MGPALSAAALPNVTQLDDVALSRRAAAGDDTAFAELCRRHTPHLLRMARSMGLSDADASDMVQEALVRALEKRHFLASVTKVRAWLYRVALNLFRSRARTASRQAQILSHHHHDVSPAFQEPVSPRDEPDAAAFSATLATLSPMQRDVVTLRAGGLSFAEVARSLGSTENACKVHMHHAVKRLRAQLAGGAP